MSSGREPESYSEHRGRRRPFPALTDQLTQMVSVTPAVEQKVHEDRSPDPGSHQLQTGHHVGGRRDQTEDAHKRQQSLELTVVGLDALRGHERRAWGWACGEITMASGSTMIYSLT